MGKMVSFYLTTEEQNALEKFCKENNCTIYSVLKAGLNRVLDEGKTETPGPPQKA